MKVALVHDDLVQWGGAERVLLAVSDIFPDAPIYTSVYDSSHPILGKYFGSKKIITSFMQKLPFWKDLYKVLLPLYPIAFEQFVFDGYDLVISQTTRFSKSIITKPSTFHLCICHTPARFLWIEQNIPNLLKPFMSFLRFYDQVSSKRVDLFLAGSKNAQRRIKKIYKTDSLLLYPPVSENFFENKKSFDGDYFLIISRLNSYKRIDIAASVFNQNGKLLKIVGTGPMLNKLKSSSKYNISFLESVSERALINLIGGCKGLIITSEEDFGLTSLEAQAMGKCVIAYGRGGVSETVLDGLPAGRQGKTGVLFTDQTEASLLKALERFDKENFKRQDLIANAKKFSNQRFKNQLIALTRKLHKT